VVFAGASLGIADRALVDALPLAADWLKHWLQTFGVRLLVAPDIDPVAHRSYTFAKAHTGKAEA
jgi:hypothetical protein